MAVKMLSTTSSIVSSPSHRLFIYSTNLTQGNVRFSPHENLQDGQWRLLDWSPHIPSVRRHILSNNQAPPLAEHLHQGWFRTSCAQLVGDVDDELEGGG
jgi:hypothetical protein